MMFNTGDLILDAVILSIVARTPEGTYGYKITQDVRSKMDVPESTFYPLLKQMQMDGYLEVYHKDLGGRSRRFYKITESGKERLEFCQQNWANYLQSASTLLMGGAAQQTEAPAMEAQPQMAAAPQVPVEEDTIQVAGNNPLDNFEFTIGGEEPVTAGNDGLSAEGDLFEFDTIPATNTVSFDTIPENTETASTVEQPVTYEEPVVTEEPIAMEQPAAYEEPVVTEEPIAMEQPVAYEEPAVTEEPVAIEQPVAVEAPVPETFTTQEEMPMDDEADFLAEMAMGDAEEAVSEEAPESETFADGIENTFSESAEISELEDLISQLRSFESVISHRVAETSPTAAANNNINITDINGVASLLNATPAEQPETKKDSGIQSSANVSAEPVKSAENTVQQPTQNIRYTEFRNPDTDDSINSLVDLLKDDQPKKKSRFFRSRAQKETPAPTAVTPEPVVNEVKEEPKKPEAKTIETTENVHKIQLTEVRNPETDDAVNSLVDLLKDDNTSSKPRLFRGWGSKKSSGAAQYMASSSPAPEPVENVVAETPVAKTEPAPVAPKPVEKVVAETASPKVAFKEIRNPENDDAVGSLVDLLKGNDVTTSSTPKIFKPKARQQKPVAPTPNEPAPSMKAPQPVPVVAKPAPEPVKPVAGRTVREVSSNNNSVDSLVELLKDDKAESKPVSIFGKASAKSYTKVAAQKTATASQPANDAASIQNTAIPKPSVSEPKVFKPTASKTFEEKAASPNARPVETTATITKSLDAKAISTKPTAAKPAEAKSVETKAVVTPKADTSPAATAEAKEEIPMDSFKYRLMQANLLPEDK